MHQIKKLQSEANVEFCNGDLEFFLSVSTFTEGYLDRVRVACKLDLTPRVSLVP